MKTFLKTMFALASFMAIVSCEDVEPTIYNESVSSTFIGFTSSTYTLPIVIDDEGSVVVTLNASTLSSVDRVYNLDIIEEETTANPNTYEMPETLVIPANSYSGSITIHGTDNGLVDVNAKPLVFEISNVTNEYYDNIKVTVNVVEVCPLSDEFVGNYRINQITPGIPLQNGGVVTIFDEDEVVALEVGNSEYERVFTAVPYSALLSLNASDFRFSLSCGQTVLSEAIDYNFSCGGEGAPTWVNDVADFQSSYNPEDDSIIEVTVTEDADAACLNAPRQCTIRLTKVN